MNKDGKVGRKPMPEDLRRKRRVIYCTDSEWAHYMKPAWEKVQARRAYDPLKEQNDVR